MVLSKMTTNLLKKINSAFSIARTLAMSGGTIVESNGTHIIERRPDGTSTVIKMLEPPTPVTQKRVLIRSNG